MTIRRPGTYLIVWILALFVVSLTCVLCGLAWYASVTPAAPAVPAGPSPTPVVYTVDHYLPFVIHQQHADDTGLACKHNPGSPMC